MVASTAVNRGLLRTYMTQAVATFAATNDAVYNLLKPFILSYVLNASIVSTGASSRNRTGNVRLVITGRSDGTLTANRSISMSNHAEIVLRYPRIIPSETR